MPISNLPKDYLFQFAVISDSHIRLPGSEQEGGYGSNRRVADRARYVVDYINALQPDFVIHLGDLVHPIPAVPDHEKAIEIAQEIFREIQPRFYTLPGNHDIGDKPNAWLPAPVIAEDSHLKFSKYWGPPYQSFSSGNCQFFCLDTPLLNAGFERENAQWAWLENGLRSTSEKGLRIFVFMHYPLFICDPDEPTHYDNIDDPARGRLLELFAQYQVEAVFSGHVHNVFAGFHGKTIFYSVPSMAFVRPEYSELATVGPGDEYGRNDTAKLGFYLVRVYPDRHEVLPVRTYGAGEFSPGMPWFDPVQAVGKPGSLPGVTLRRGWGRRVELAADGLDEFTRKEAYRDGLLVALLELGITQLRVPFADLAHADVRTRLADFVRLGFEFTVYSLGAPDEHTLGVVDAYGSLLANWELIFPKAAAAQVGIALRQAREVFAGSLFIAPVVGLKLTDSSAADGSKTFQHFASHGFAGDQMDAAKQWLGMAADAAGEVGVTFRVSPWEAPAKALARLAQWDQSPKLVNLQLPRGDEGMAFEDNNVLSAFVVEAWQASRGLANTTLFLDTFVDSDRGYYPRIGLLDRQFNPRPAFYALKLAALEG